MTPQEAIEYLHTRIDAVTGNEIIWTPDDLYMTELLDRAFTVDEHGDYQPRPWVAHDGPKLSAGIFQSMRPGGVRVAAESPCPDWCDLQHDHPFSSEYLQPIRLVGSDTDEAQNETSTAASRTHRHRFSPIPVHAALEVIERAATFDTSATDLGSRPAALTIAIYVNSERAAFTLTPGGSRRLGEQLLAAADLAEKQLAEWAGPDTEAV